MTHVTGIPFAALIRRVESRRTAASISTGGGTMPAGVRPRVERDIRPRILAVEDSAVSLSLTTQVRCTPYFQVQLEFLHTITLEQPVPERDVHRAENMRALVELCLPYHAGLVGFLCQQMGVPPIVTVPVGEPGA